MVVPPPGLCTLEVRDLGGGGGGGGYLQAWNLCLDFQGPALRQGIQRARPMYWSPDPGVTQGEGSSQFPTKKEQPSSKELVIRSKKCCVP